MKKLITIIAVTLALGAGIILATSSSKDTDQPATDSSSEMNAMDMPATQTETTPAPSTTAPQAQGSSVSIENFAYGPATITVKKGTTVTWTNKDATRHDVNPDKPTSEFKQSELLGKGESYKVTFNTVGSFSYHCSPHPQMQGTVVVTE